MIFTNWVADRSANEVPTFGFCNMECVREHYGATRPRA